MGKKDNFNRAMFEMFGVGKEPDESLIDELDPMQDGDGGFGGVPGGPGGPSGPGGGDMPPFDGGSMQFGVEMPTTVIAPGTVIEGNIRSTGHLDMGGELRGDLQADGSIIVRGTITGNIHGARVDMVSCTVLGDIKAEGAVTVDASSKLKGNIMASDVTADGAIQGDLDVKHAVSLRAGAVVMGSITAQTMSMETNVALRGSVMVPRDSKGERDGSQSDDRREAEGGRMA